MVRLEIEMAVIGAVNELLCNPQETSGEYPLLNDEIIFEYLRMMEARSGYAVVNGFSRKSLDWFFSNYNQLFQHDPHRSMQDKQFYRLRIDKLLPHLELSDGGRCQLNQPQINTLIKRMMDILDPCVNYPLDFLNGMRLLGVLEGNEDDTHGLELER